MSTVDTLNLASAADRGRVRGWVDGAPRLSSRADMPIDALSDFWRSVIVGLLDMVDEASGAP